MAGQSISPQQMARTFVFVRIDGPARWTQRPEQRFTVSLIPLLQHAAECQPIQDSALAGYCRGLNCTDAASRAREQIRHVRDNR
jgi:hypothetical protein